jgi:hypothetical protein
MFWHRESPGRSLLVRGWVMTLVLAMLGCPSLSLAEVGPGLVLVQSSPRQYRKALHHDFAEFCDLAARLERDCETILTEGSILDAAADPTVLLPPQAVRPIMEFWARFERRLERLAGIATRWHRPWTQIGSTDLEHGFEGYLLGVTAKLARLQTVSHLARFLDERPRLKTLFNEPDTERKLAARRFDHHVWQAIRPREVMSLYRFHTSHLEAMNSFYAGSAPGKPQVDLHGILPKYLKSALDVLDGLVARVAKDPLWYKIMMGHVGADAGEIVRPLQESLFTWVGDTRVRRRKTRLITSLQVQTMQRSLRPGDIIVERQNWYLSNIFLSGFWPHAALYIGTPADVANAIDTDADVRAFYARRGFKGFLEWAQRTYPDKFRQWNAAAVAHEPLRVLEAISDGVVFNTLEHSCHADYVGVMRPRLPPLEIAKALEGAFFLRRARLRFRF